MEIRKEVSPTVDVKLGCQGAVFWFRNVLKVCRSRQIALLPTSWHSRNEYADCAAKADGSLQIRILELNVGHVLPWMVTGFL